MYPLQYLPVPPGVHVENPCLSVSSYSKPDSEASMKAVVFHSGSENNIRLRAEIHLNQHRRPSEEDLAQSQSVLSLSVWVCGQSATRRRLAGLCRLMQRRAFQISKKHIKETKWKNFWQVYRPPKHPIIPALWHNALWILMQRNMTSS